MLEQARSLYESTSVAYGLLEHLDPVCRWSEESRGSFANGPLPQPRCARLLAVKGFGGDFLDLMSHRCCWSSGDPPVRFYVYITRDEVPSIPGPMETCMYYEYFI